MVNTKKYQNKTNGSSAAKEQAEIRPAVACPVACSESDFDADLFVAAVTQLVRELYDEVLRPSGKNLQWFVARRTGTKLNAAQLREVCGKAPLLSLANDPQYVSTAGNLSGGKGLSFFAELQRPPRGFKGFPSTEDEINLPQELLQRLMLRLSKGGWPVFAGVDATEDRLNIAAWLQSQSSTKPRLSLGDSVLIIQKAVKDKVLGRHSNRIVPFRYSEDCMKLECATSFLPMGVKGGEKYVGTWEHLRMCLASLLRKQGWCMPIAKIKLAFRAEFSAELAETAFGHLSLTQLFTDTELTDAFELELYHSGEYFLHALDAAKNLAEPGPSSFYTLGHEDAKKMIDSIHTIMHCTDTNEKQSHSTGLHSAHEWSPPRLSSEDSDMLDSRSSIDINSPEQSQPKRSAGRKHRGGVGRRGRGGKREHGHASPTKNTCTQSWPSWDKNEAGKEIMQMLSVEIVVKDSCATLSTGALEDELVESSCDPRPSPMQKTKQSVKEDSISAEGDKVQVQYVARPLRNNRLARKADVQAEISSRAPLSHELTSRLQDDTSIAAAITNDSRHNVRIAFSSEVEISRAPALEVESPLSQWCCVNKTFIDIPAARAPISFVARATSMPPSYG